MIGGDLMNHHIYQGKLMINPEQGRIHAKLNISYQVMHHDTDELILYIHKDMMVNEITCQPMSQYHLEDTISDWCPFITDSKKLSISLTHTIGVGETIEIYLDYEGCIGNSLQWEVNRVTTELVELGSYSPWYPVTPEFDLACFDIYISLNEDYVVLNGYDLKKVDDHTWHLVQEEPHMDCTIIASHKFQAVEASQHDEKIRIYYMLPEHEQVANQMYDVCKWLISHYSNLYGEISLQKYLTIANVDRNKGGGYCRPGLIVMTIDKPEDGVNLRYLAHELAHLWWHLADVNTYEDWLNESFAEYSSLMSVRMREGQERFDYLINRYQEIAKDLPAITSIKRSDEVAYHVLYVKGPVLLYHLEQKIGEDLFKQLLKRMFQNKIVNTKDFMTLLSEVTNEKTSNYFEELLNQ